jgi:hypothetical protein
MSTTVIVNNMTTSHKGSSGISTAFPDVCKTPAPPAPPVPIPYPNVAQSSDVDGGSKDVLFDGKSICLKKSKIKTSTGDEAGTLNGIVSNKIKGKAAFANYSFDVKVEGSNVCRLADPTTQNMGTMNAAAFFHAQSPAVGDAAEVRLVKAACNRVKKKTAKKETSDASATGKSGIVPPHVAAIQKVVDDRAQRPNEGYTLYFRKTNADCGKWIITHKNQPKPHTCTAGKTIKGGDVAAVQAWLDRNPDSPQHRRCGGSAATLTGVVRSTVSGRWANSPRLGQGKFKGGWMTGDYDLMDVHKIGGQCQRPTPEEFETLRHECNKAMKWPGIQHGPQSAWDTKEDPHFKGESHFNVEDELNQWMSKSRKEAQLKRSQPARNIAPGRAPLPLVDNQLTVFGPGGAVALDKHADYWDALACCGCRVDPDDRIKKKAK